MKYKAIALDLDGTLLNSKKEVSSKNKEIIKKAAKAGVKIILASGRPVPGIVKIAKQLHLEEVGGYILSYNGGMIIDCKTKEVVRRETLPIEYFADIVRCANKFGVASLTYDSEGIITNDENDKYVQIESRINNIPVRQVFHLDEEAQLDPPVKFLCTGEHKVLKQVQDKLNEKLNGAVTIFFSEPYFLEIMPQGIEKASSLEILLNKLGIDKKYLIACGDGYNDIPMMQYAGLSVAMANAQEETKEWADYIAPSNDEDGVAAAIEKFIF
ncbi:Cof-type HAD-IIB family hydrolase [Pseudobutyrivibrio sp. MD2005]|uniref:Cof-type HAD-IIB family hydrolase n=1 Tax=Pseudobutyrivibrio sp. MD2005 TaxID=1410616 RepID=UPI000488A3E4|nr:Cof-type HAD-IIB family hydrolase [Pseudobutyrivibrio sp. MD2005]